MDTMPLSPAQKREAMRTMLDEVPPLPNEDDVILYLRSILRQMANDTPTNISVPRPRTATDSSVHLNISFFDNKGWVVEYDSQEFSASYHEHGVGPTLAQAFDHLDELHENPAECPICTKNGVYP